MGNGESSFQLFQDQENQVYVTYRLSTNNLNNGADDFYYGIEVTSRLGVKWDEVLEGNYAFCKHIGSSTFADFEFRVDAGAGGWSGSSSCTSTWSWEGTFGLQIKVTGPETSFSVSVGHSSSCSDGTIYDSEVLLQGPGSASIPLAFEDLTVRLANSVLRSGLVCEVCSQSPGIPKTGLY